MVVINQNVPIIRQGFSPQSLSKGGSASATVLNWMSTILRQMAQVDAPYEGVQFSACFKLPVLTVYQHNPDASNNVSQIAVVFRRVSQYV
jgi:hypothetical protein